MHHKDTIILGIESSCDDTSCAIVKNGKLIANVVSSQLVHSKYGGVVPELASRNHMQNIVHVVEEALQRSGIKKIEISAISFTQGPGLIGSLMVGTSFAKSLSLSLDVPLINVNHMEAHIIANFICREKEEKEIPSFPFLCLTVSGGHTQIVKITAPTQFELLGETLDDAAGEAFDKGAKILGLPYPGGPLIDKFAQQGNSKAFNFPISQVKDFHFSFSGLKTSLLYFVNDKKKIDPSFVEKNINDICASYQHAINITLIKKLIKASTETNIKTIALAGGVSANSGLRKAIQQTALDQGWRTFIPDLEFCTDNAAMIAMMGTFKFEKNDFCGLDALPIARYPLGK